MDDAPQAAAGLGETAGGGEGRAPRDALEEDDVGGDVGDRDQQDADKFF